LRNYFCSEYCALEYHGIEKTDDWPGNDDADEQEKETRENYYLATYAKFGCITNHRYLIWGIETPREIDNGSLKSVDIQRIINRALTSGNRASAKSLNWPEDMRANGECYKIFGRAYKTHYVDIAFELLCSHRLNAFCYDDNLVLLDGDSGERGAVIAEWN
jgi:hypothetical protein